MFMKAAVASVLKRLGYRNVLLYNSLICSVFLMACATFVPGMPFWAMIAILLVGGFFRSLQFTSINTIAYAEIDPPRMSRATALTAVAQQLSLSTGVAVGALVVEITLRLRHETAMSAVDFSPRFFWSPPRGRPPALFLPPLALEQRWEIRAERGLRRNWWINGPGGRESPSPTDKAPPNPRGSPPA